MIQVPSSISPGAGSREQEKGLAENQSTWQPGATTPGEEPGGSGFLLWRLERCSRHVLPAGLGDELSFRHCISLQGCLMKPADWAA